MDSQVVHKQGKEPVRVVLSQLFEKVDEVIAVDGLVVDVGQTRSELGRHGSHHGSIPLVDVSLVDTEVRVPLTPVSLLYGELGEYDFV